MSENNSLLFFIPFIFCKHNQMNCQEVDIENSSCSQTKPKIRGVIVLTDNRQKQSNQKTMAFDYRSSAFKQTDVDPLEFQKNDMNYTQDEELMAELNRRVLDLQKRVAALSNSEGIVYMSAESQQQQPKKKNRRKFKELVRSHECTYCQKVYGSDTSLKFHIKIKHTNNQNHSQVQ